jgi:hypothetical protein
MRFFVRLGNKLAFSQPVQPDEKSFQIRGQPDLGDAARRLSANARYRSMIEATVTRPESGCGL